MAWWVGAVALGLYLLARKARPAKPKAGGSVGAQLTTEPETLTVASFNIQTGKNLQGQRDINRAATALESAHLGGIQEVYAASWLNRLGLGKSQSQMLAAGSHSKILFAATRRRWFREHRGNALLSKLAINRWYTIMLPDESGKSFRNYTLAELDWQGCRVHFINTHLHTRAGRDQQLAIVLNEFARYPRVILVGDFNTAVNNPLLAKVLQEPDVRDAIAEAGLAPDDDERIDWILCKGFSVVSGRSFDKGISDHPYYEVTLALDHAPANL